METKSLPSRITSWSLDLASISLLLSLFLIFGFGRSVAFSGAYQVGSLPPPSPFPPPSELWFATAADAAAFYRGLALCARIGVCRSNGWSANYEPFGCNRVQMGVSG